MLSESGLSQNIPIILITPGARAALAAEAGRAGVSGKLIGGLLFGHPLGEHQRLVVSSIRLSSDVGFGRRDFSLDQTRTSRQLENAQRLDPEAIYCGVWYLHRTPNPELINEEWEQTRAVLEDPDFAFEDLVCLVICFYSGKLEIFASSFNRYHSTRGQPPSPTELRLTTDRRDTPPYGTPVAAASPATDWYKSPDVAGRLNQEYHRLAEKYQTESALTPSGQVFFRLSPKRKYQKLAFCFAVEDEFPDKAPEVYLIVDGRPRRISIPSLGSWSASSWLVDLADELVEWLAFSIDEYLTAAEEALGRGNYAAAADLVKLVLSIEPRTPGAPRLLARAQAA
jgi:hypothetical protein